MRFIDLDELLPHIRHLLPQLEAARSHVLTLTDPVARSAYIKANSSLWTALRREMCKLSHGKCWYTECYNPGTDDDVDHFRPKLAVHEDDSHPGYFWEAFNWRNFRLSCHRANRRRINPESAVTEGKGDYFPLLPSGVRAFHPGPGLLERELPALLDPTNPADPPILTFKPNGEVDLIPELKGNANAELRLAESRVLLALDWPTIRDDRVMLYNKIDRLIDRGQREAPSDIHGFLSSSDAFKDVLKDLRVLALPKSQYTMAARTYIKSFKHVWWVQQIVLEIVA